MKGFCSWSGGKDCSLALQKCRLKGMNIDCLVCMLDETGQRSRSHGLRLSLLEQQADLLGCNLVTAITTWENYEATYKGILMNLKDEGYSFGVFGDIDGESNRKWEEDLCSSAGIEAILPLWGMSCTEVAKEFLESGMVVRICTCISELSHLLGRQLSQSVFENVVSLGYDICGENGEYHSVLLAAPLMNMPLIKVRSGQIVVVGNKTKLSMDFLTDFPCDDIVQNPLKYK